MRRLRCVSDLVAANSRLLASKATRKVDGAGHAAATAFDASRVRQRFDAALEALRRDLGRLGAGGRASAGAVEGVAVATAPGMAQPLGQLASVSSRDAATLLVRLYDVSLVAAAEAGLRASPLRFVPRVEGDALVVPLPEPSAQQRAQLARMAAAAGEGAKAAGRRVRQEAMDELRRGGAGAPQDEQRRAERDLQKAADDYAAEVALLTKRAVDG